MPIYEVNVVTRAPMRPKVVNSPSGVYFWALESLFGGRQTHMGAGTFTKRERQHAAPIFIDRLDEGGIAKTISPIHVQSETQHDEAWLQRLIFSFPQALPVHEIEPGFSRLVPVCLELPTPAGSVDNLYVTDRGDLVIAECKLWRNPESRREVVAQIIDYAHSMNRWTYADLQGAVKRALIPETRPAAGLYDLVKPATEIDEADFVDAITRNLRLGRMLLLIVGDGIREGVETLSDFLQMHAGFHFTLGIIEMPVYGLPNGGFVVQPRVLARTINIERGVVSIVDGRPHLSSSVSTTESPSARRRTSISQERLLEMLEEVEPGLPAALQSFIDGGAEMGVTLEAAPKSLQIRWRGLGHKLIKL